MEALVDVPTQEELRDLADRLQWAADGVAWSVSHEDMATAAHVIQVLANRLANQGKPEGKPGGDPCISSVTR